jgi:hypothetical protein
VPQARVLMIVNDASSMSPSPRLRFTSALGHRRSRLRRVGDKQ